MIAGIMGSTNEPPFYEWKQEGDQRVLALGGDWLRDGPAPDAPATSLGENGGEKGGGGWRFDCERLGSYDSTLPAFLLTLFRDGKRDDFSDQIGGLPEDLRGLMELALAVPEESEAGVRAGQGKKGLLERWQEVSRKLGRSALGVMDFTGLLIFSLGRFFTGRARYRSAELWLTVQECGAQALPIVSLISFLIGMILAFVGGYQLAGFGAEIFVADLVGIAMVREMGVVMAGIIMSGRTGAAFAAHIGSMKANEEIDALRTFGLDPFDFLVLPRVLALVLMMPILTVYANVVGILGGMMVGAATGIPIELYFKQTLSAIDLTTASLGVFKSFFFGVAIAMCGCFQGMKAASSSAGVGQATTRAVVASITAVIVLDSGFAAIFTIFDI